MKRGYTYLLFIVVMLLCFTGCVPFRDSASEVSGEMGEMSDELGKKREIGSQDNPITIHPMDDKKIKMEF